MGENRVLQRVFEHLAAEVDNEYAMIDSTIVRAHQHSAGVKKVGEGQAIGRSRGGQSTKIRALVDALGKAVAFALSGGQAHDLFAADQLLPSMKAHIFLADQAYDANERVHDVLQPAGKSAVIPPKSNREAPRTYDRHLYRERYLIENLFCNFKQYRAIATQCEKTAWHFLAAVYLVAAANWLK